MKRPIYLAFPLIWAAGALAQPFLGSWFQAGGEFHACLINPAIPCPQSDFSASEAERVVHKQAVSDLQFSQQSVYSYSDSTHKVQDVDGNMGFRMRFATVRGSSLGLGVSIPYPKRKFETDSAAFVSRQNPGQATLLLGSDLVQFVTGDEEAAHRILLDVELPIYYDPGLWAAHLEWLWKRGFRLRSSFWSVAPREDLLLTSDHSIGSRFRWHEQIGQMLMAARPISWFEIGARGAWSQVESRAREGELGAAGDIAQAGASLRLGTESWRLLQSLEFQEESVAFAWNDSVPTEHYWQVGSGQYNKIWVYQSRLEKNIDPLRYGFWSERRWWNSRTGSGHGETDAFGLEIRYQGRFFSLEPGIAWINGFLDVQSNGWADWNGTVSTGNIGGYQAVTPSCKIVILGGGSKITYSWREAFPWQGHMEAPGVKASWGAEHRLSITGNF